MKNQPEQTISAFNISSDDDKSTFSKYSRSVISTKTRDGKKKINQYIVMKLIGKGNFGKVKLVLNTEEDDKPYAMKCIPKRKKIKGLIGGKITSELDDIMNEIAVMKKLVRADKTNYLESRKHSPPQRGTR
jgi:serine/threonine protein kinase